MAMTLPVVAPPAAFPAPSAHASELSVFEQTDSRVGAPGSVEFSGQFARHLSPLRYPGAKSRLVPKITQIIARAREKRSVPRIELFVEPFAGGASTSLRLLSLGLVERVLLGEADPLVASFWMTAASEPEALIERITTEYDSYVVRGGVRALERWDYWRGWSPDASLSPADARLETATRCLFLNRTTFSGILHGRAGPLGGRRQESENTISCRFNPDALAERIRYVGHLYAQGRIVDVLEADWQTTMDAALQILPRLSADNMLAYLDPPYVDKASNLYRKAFGPRPIDDGPVWQGDAMDHFRLAGYLRTKTPMRWLLSYDKHPALLSHPLLYSAGRVGSSGLVEELRRRRITKRVVSTTYTASARMGRGATEELLISTLPPAAMAPDDSMWAAE